MIRYIIEKNAAYIKDYKRKAAALKYAASVLHQGDVVRVWEVRDNRLNKTIWERSLDPHQD